MGFYLFVKFRAVKVIQAALGLPEQPQNQRKVAVIVTDISNKKLQYI